MEIAKKENAIDHIIAKMKTNEGDEHLQMDFFGFFANIQPLPIKTYKTAEKKIL